MKQYIIGWQEQGDSYSKVIDAIDENDAYNIADNILGNVQYSLKEY